jgi:hypothetical protein
MCLLRNENSGCGWAECRWVRDTAISPGRTTILYAYPFGYAPYGLYPGDWVAASYWYPISSPYPYYAPDTFRYGNGRGEIRLTADPKEAKVYIDGGYAGTADKLKTLWLDPGAYDLTVSAAGREDFHERLYVLSGKILKISAKLDPEQTKENP